MNSTEIIKALRISDVNIDDITMLDIKQNRIIPILYQQKKSLIFQTPFLEIQDVVSKTRHPDINQFITLFAGDTKKRIDNFFHFIEDIEIHIKNHAPQTGNKWFTQKDVTLTSLIRELDNGDPYIKWPFDITTSIFVDENKQPFNFKDIKKKDCVKIIVELSNLWIDKNQCGLAVAIQKVLVKQHQEKIQSEYVFDDDESDSDIENEEQTKKIISLFATEQKPHSLSKKSKYVDTKPPNNIPTSEVDPKKILLDHRPGPRGPNTKADSKSKTMIDAQSKKTQSKSKNTTPSSHFVAGPSFEVELVGNVHKKTVPNKNPNKNHAKAKPELYISTSSEKMNSTSSLVGNTSTSSDNYGIIDSGSI